MKCQYCLNQTTGGAYICADCWDDIMTRSAAAETKAREVACPSCRSEIGKACRTSSGTKRGIAHETRKAVAERTANGR